MYISLNQIISSSHYCRLTGVGILTALRELRKIRADHNEKDRDISRRMMQVNLEDSPASKFTYQPGNSSKSLFEGTFDGKEIEEAASKNM